MKRILERGISRAVRHTLTVMLLAIMAPLPALSPAPQCILSTMTTPMAVTDPNQAVVWEANKKPFGETTVIGTIHEHSRFPGQMFDEETRLSYNYFRDYDPSLGRYVQSDPIGLNGGLNTYAYVGGNPLMYTDPLGLDTLTCERPLHGMGGIRFGPVFHEFFLRHRSEWRESYMRRAWSFGWRQRGLRKPRDNRAR